MGDTFAFGDEVIDQHEREHAAMRKLRESTRSPGVHRLIDFWEEYEAQATPTARFVKGLDAILPIAQNYSNPEQSSWRAHGVSAENVHKRLRSHGETGRLRKYAEQMIDSAKHRGDLI